LGGSGSLSQMASGHAEEVPRRSSSKAAVSLAEEMSRRPANKTVSSHTGNAQRRHSSKKSATFNAVDAADSPECRPDLPTEVVAQGSRRSQTKPLHDKSNETATDELAVVRHHGGRRISYFHTNVRQPTPLGDEHNALPSVFGTLTLPQSLAARWLPAQDRSPAPVAGSMGQSRRLSSKQASYSGAGLEAAVVGRVSGKIQAEKKASSMNIILSANQMRNASIAAPPRSSYRLLPDTDRKGLVSQAQS